MIPIVSIVGKSDSGKTTLLEKLVPELTARGWRVATIKHDVHGFEIDHEGKDSYRHKKAGAHTAVISSPQRVAVIADVNHDHNLEELGGRFIRDVDLILSEGFKRDRAPKIEVFRQALHRDLLSTPAEGLIAVAADVKLEVPVPLYDINDAAGLAMLLEEKFLRAPRKTEVFLKVNRRAIPLKPHIAGLLINLILGMTKSLKGCEDPKEIEIRIG